MSRLGLFVGRFVAMAAMMLWAGGFTFYGGVVVAILEDALGSFDAGMITRRVTNALNLIGLMTVAAWVLLAYLERHARPRWATLGRLGLLTVTALSLAALAALHVIMDRHLDSQGVRGFRIWHRRYLMVSTVQWIANLGILALTIRLWTQADEKTTATADWL